MATVAIIGAGVQGLAALKNLREEGFDAVVYESKSVIGGVWNFNDNPGQTTVLPGTLTNISKYRTCFTDFPAPEDAPVYMTSQQMLDYILSYATHFNLAQHVELNTEVLRIIRSEDDKAWQLVMRHNEKTRIRSFDKVIVATGINVIPHMPVTENREVFQGTVIHSQAFKRAEEFQGQKVLVVGLGSTAADTCSFLNGVSAKVYLSHRNGGVVLPRWVNGKPYDMGLNRRRSYLFGALETLPVSLSAKMTQRAIESMADSCSQPDPGWNFKPTPSMVTHRPIVSDDLVEDLRAGSTESVAGFRRFIDARHLELSDGTRLEIDAVIFCTGYLLKSSIVPEIPTSMSSRAPDWMITDPRTASEPRLYQGIFLTAHAESFASLLTLGFGLAPMTMGDLVTMAIAQIWKGNYPLPSRSRMEANADEYLSYRLAVAEDPKILPRVLEPLSWLNWLNDAAGTGVNEHLGYGLQGWRFWLQNRELCHLLMDGVVDSPHVMRLFDGRRKKWDGAEQAIRAANLEAELQLKKKAAEEKGELRGEKPLDLPQPLSNLILNVIE